MERLHQLIEPWLASQPDATAFIDYTKQPVSYAEFDQAIEQAAEILKKQGVVGGDRVMIVAENSVATVAFLFAASRLNAWASLLNARLTGKEIDKLRDHAEPKVMIFTSAVSEAAKAHAMEREAHRSAGAFGDVMVARSRQDSVAEPVEEAGKDQVAVLLYTTGTTGMPKGVMLTHENLISAARLSSGLRDLQPDDHLLLVLPITHVFGLASVTLAALRSGTTVELMPRFEPAPIFEALTERVTSFPAVPQMHAQLMAYARQNGIERLQAKRLRYVSSGGAPLDPDWKAALTWVVELILECNPLSCYSSVSKSF